MSTALVTGAYGFVGTHLRTELRARGYDVVGLGRSPREPDPGERHVQADLCDTAAVTGALADVRPELIFHLAASPAFKHGGNTGAMVADAVTATVSLCSAITTAAIKTRMVLAGSSAQYGGLAPEENPVTEESRFNPLGAYGLVKVAAEAAARAFATGGDFELIPVRAFNHVGPGEPLTTVASSFASRILAVLDGTAETVSVMDLECVRDFTDVRDIARGYADLAERGTPDRVYNLCSGRPATVGDVLDGLLAAAGLDRSAVRVMPAAPGGLPYQVGSPARVQEEIGWNASIALRSSVHDLFAQVRSTTEGARSAG